MASDDPSAQSMAEDWYNETGIILAVQGNFRDEPHRRIPVDTSSVEFAKWLTHEYRLAMAKGIELERSRVRGLFAERSKETTRSVRDNPQPGDVVRGVSGNNRLVTKLDGNNVYYRRLRGVREGTETRCWIKTWQDWAIGPAERTAAESLPKLEVR